MIEMPGALRPTLTGPNNTASNKHTASDAPCLLITREVRSSDISSEVISSVLFISDALMQIHGTRDVDKLMSIKKQ